MNFLFQILWTIAILAFFSNEVMAKEAASEDYENAEARSTIQSSATEKGVAKKSTHQPSGWVLTEKPVPGKLSSPFGNRHDPVASRRRLTKKSRRAHKGVDFVAPRGSSIYASGPGIVIHAGVRGGYGRLVIVDHGHGLQTRYAHLERIKVKPGEFLPVGAILGTVGSSGAATGPHLHFEVRVNGVALPPSKVIQFKLPPCAATARNCKRRKRRPNNT